MKTKIQIKSIFGNVLFEYECEENTIKKTVEKAVKVDASLRNASLRNASLVGASLVGASLDGASLYGASLDGASLVGASLVGASLRNASLVGAKNLNTAYLPIYCKWDASVLGEKIVIGCKEKTIDEWEAFFNSNEEYLTKRNTPEFKKIQAVYLAYKAYLTHLKS